MKKIVLAYSGGLDTSLCIHWLKHKRGFSVITYSANLGQRLKMEEAVERALAIGASTVHIGELEDRFVHDYVLPAVKANAQFRANSFLAAALSRPIIAYEMVKTALDEAAPFIAHGGTAWGNDQVRFETAVASLEPKLKTVAPLREWDFENRTDEIEYATKHNIPVHATNDSPYSIDQNIWGTSIDCTDVGAAWKEGEERVFLITKNPEDAPDEPLEIKITFNEGVPSAIDGKHYAPVKLIRELNAIGGEYGIGRGEALEDRLLGYKALKIYEAPGAELIFKAHRALEDITLPANLIRLKQDLSRQYSEIIYQGDWFTDLREALDSFFDTSQKYVSGDVVLRLFKGASQVVSRESTYSLFDPSRTACSTRDKTHNRKAAEGYMGVRRLQHEAEARRRKTKRL